MKEALRHFITKTNMLNFLLVQTILAIYAMLCFHTVVSDIDFERKKHVITDTVVSKALSTGPTNYCPGLPVTARRLPGDCPES